VEPYRYVIYIILICGYASYIVVPSILYYNRYIYIGILTTASSGRDGHRPDRVRLQQVDRPPRRWFLERFCTPPAIVHCRWVSVVCVSRTSAPSRRWLVGRLVHSHVGTCESKNGRVIFTLIIIIITCKTKKTCERFFPEIIYHFVV